ncbi:unnamed protein product [Thlaspi arvense]|uniref:Uncharacterized protein n=1 Tax=Thlaspi arvense TaxID=13288 RepID=A0AAU9T848_THLAR|nr:unnamed protein product [Thlaspi arvense]
MATFSGLHLLLFSFIIATDLNANCPTDLRVLDGGNVVACKSACEAFNKPEYCCTGPFNKPGDLSSDRFLEDIQSSLSQSV